MTSGKTDHGAKLQQAKARAPQNHQQRSLWDQPALKAVQQAAPNSSPVWPMIPSAALPEPLPSTATRETKLTSRGHFCGEMVIGDGSGQGGVSGVPPRVVLIESYLEYRWCLCLSVHRDVADIREQMACRWIDHEGLDHTHYFDFLLLMRDGRRIACAVRPVSLARPAYVHKLGQISAQACASGFADEVRLLTDQDLDPVDLHNAGMLHGSRAAVPEIDTIAQGVVASLRGRMPLGELTEQVGYGPQGYRALLRLLRKGALRLSEKQRITPKSLVYREAMV